MFMLEKWIFSLQFCVSSSRRPGNKPLCNLCERIIKNMVKKMKLTMTFVLIIGFQNEHSFFLLGAESKMTKFGWWIFPPVQLV